MNYYKRQDKKEDMTNNNNNKDIIKYIYNKFTTNKIFITSPKEVLSPCGRGPKGLRVFKNLI